MHDIAKELNEQIRAENPYVYELLSDLGKNLYYPKGILTQTDEATEKAYRFNATIGMATEKGQPMFLPVIQETLSEYNPQDIYTYAPPAGKPSIRAVWREKLFKDNPSLQGKTMSQPIVTNALTHGLSIVADLFLNPQDVLVLPDKIWGNYSMIFGTRRNARLQNFTFFTDKGQFNTQGMKEVLLAQKEQGKAVLLLNFPNNPTGYTPIEEEAQAIVEALLEVAEQGINLVVLSDDAYFGLFYEDSIKESLFGRLANIHPRILAVKVDGPTKEEYVWGFRVGFITFADSSSVVCNALENKTKAIIRGTISNASHPAQTFVLHALESPDFIKQKQEKYKIMEGRALKVKELLNRGDYQDLWDYYPFNSGYFMCLKLKGVKAEELRLHLLHNYGVGVIALGESDIRVAFSCVEEEDLEELFTLIYQGTKDLA
ncbi:MULTISPECIES: aminotransferase class I/II-fold pyridoxal phosphate-dependent enzyme [Desulfitobacterium]|uniref:Aspartate/tyrosine/aromatic aminotransferase n=1 Tax=Desulfitobacterium dehalogenans (strain ATCC 51507 / DSM 9161 / JW/IU-DC1) TaxID=756499 RepID=I4A9U9_DESDJ|nr:MULTISPECIES: aminotransferase class I/II-fold pyridoxal phosphate-dependent enzyme [Desulfitobacterium]AFM00734.1 aspartate/tyrosine/aromatic aminotransferase [Desulfitobacterium dehalogenans ATCC 51507]